MSASPWETLVAAHKNLQTVETPDHVPASHAAKAKSCVHRPEHVDVTTRTSHNDGFITIGAGFIVHGFSLFPARRFLIMHFRAGYSSIGEPQKITVYSPGRRRQFYNFIMSNGTFLIIVKLSGTYYEPWYLFRSFEKTYSKCSSCSRLVSQIRHIRSLREKRLRNASN